MLERIFARRKDKAPRVPDGYRVYAVGDIHGRDDLLAELLEQIESDRRQRPAATELLIFLGDLIDRGPQSAEVIERLRHYRPDGARTLFLAGNHEEVLLRLLDGRVEILADWLRFGGAECLASYGVDPRRLRRMAPERALAAIRSAIPEAHRDFLRAMADTFRIGDYLFVHAGIRPGLSLEQQRQADLRWIRRPFLDDRSDHGFIVVHGHTISDAVDERSNRIGLDTGAYFSGVLTAIGLEAESRWFLQTGSTCDAAS